MAVFGDTKRLVDEFRTHWQSATADNNLTLNGFRRFKTTHLLNLRFLESEIADLDHQIYQAGLSLNLSLSLNDRLALKHSKRDKNVPEIRETISNDLVVRLRDLVQRYDEGILAFNKIMAMETFSLLDDEKQSSTRSDLSLARCTRRDSSELIWNHDLASTRFSDRSANIFERSDTGGYRGSYKTMPKYLDLFPRIISGHTRIRFFSPIF